MRYRWTVLVSLIVFAAIAVPCVAQSRSDVKPSTAGSDVDPGMNEFLRFGSYDALKRRIKEANPGNKSLAELLAEDKTDAAALVASQKLSCTVSNAVLIAVDEKAHTKTYEVSCQGGPGYFLVQSEPPAKPEGFTCFAADAARKADIAAHRTPGVGCGLPENPGVKELATSILKSAGKVCMVKDVLWRGQSATTDFTEAACTDGTGYVIRSPLPGSQAPVRISTCIESGQAGLACRLSESDPLIIASRNALKQHNVACDADQVHVIGHETIKKRQVVEFSCPKQQPKGLVAFIPLDGSMAPFEALDCVQAAQRRAICTLNKSN